MKWIPKVVYDKTATPVKTLQLSLPQRLWTPASLTVGGTDTSAAGVPESFVIRRDQLLDVRFQFLEGEWPAVHAWIRWMQDTAGSCDYFPDRNVSTSYPCYLESPKVGEEVRPERGEFPGTYEISLRLRDTRGGDPFDVRAYV